MENFDESQKMTKTKWEYLFYTYTSKDAIMNKFDAGCIASGYYHNKYPRHVIVAFCQAEKMLGLVAMRADIGVEKENESEMYFCRFTEDVEWETFSPKQHIHSNVKVGALMLPFTKKQRVPNAVFCYIF